MVGGGPTGVEFSGELSDFIRGDVHRNFGHVKSFIRVTLVEVFMPIYLSLSSVRLFFYRGLSCIWVDIYRSRNRFKDVIPVLDEVQLSLSEFKSNYPGYRNLIHKTCHLQANELLASFDVRLREYATNHLIAVCCWWSCSVTLT